MNFSLSKALFTCKCENGYFVFLTSANLWYNNFILLTLIRIALLNFQGGLMHKVILIIVSLWVFGATAADLPVYRDNQFVERIQTDERGREILSYVDYDGLPITGTVQSFKNNENKIVHAVDGLAQGTAHIERVNETVTNLIDETENNPDANDEDEIILIQRNKQIWQIPYEKGIIDGTVFVYDTNNNLINEQIYGAGVKTVESFYRSNGSMYKYVRYFPNDRVVPLVQEEKLYDESGKVYAQIDTTFHDNGLIEQRQETVFDKYGVVLSTFFASYDLTGNLIDAAFSAERKFKINEEFNMR